MRNDGEYFKKQRTEIRERLAKSICEELFGPFDRDELDSPASVSAQSMKAAFAVIDTMAHIFAKVGWEEDGIMKPHDKMVRDSFVMLSNLLFGSMRDGE